MTEMEARHRALAEIALAAAGSYGLALAGGYAVRGSVELISRTQSTR